VGREVVDITWERFALECGHLAVRHKSFRWVWGVPTGGSLVALHVARILDLTVTNNALAQPPGDVLVVDDLVDSGKTLMPYRERGYAVDALFRKSHSPKMLAPSASVVDGWLNFPWEHESAPESAVTRLLEYIGEDPSRDGLVKTPERVVRALREMTQGYHLDPKEILGTAFEVPFDEMVVLRGVRFSSMCEHHMLPFIGTCDVGYIPQGTDSCKVIGLSKLARVVDCFARRLQIQERMTHEIAQAVMEHADAKGVGVVVRAHHSCMGCRGVKQPDTEMVTSVMLGALLEDDKARSEFLELCKA
jgi:GTP cyclohydrolase I